jgi:hypothetical protein
MHSSCPELTFNSGFTPTSSQSVAAITEPVPAAIPTTQPAQIQGTIELAGFNNKRLKAREASVDGLRLLQIENAGRILEKRQSGCIFFISVDNNTVYTVDINTLTQGQTIPFNSSDFTPNSNSSIAYVEQCPPGTTNFPQLNVANLTLVTGPAAPAAVSTVSFASLPKGYYLLTAPQSSIPESGTIITVTTTYSIIFSGSTIIQTTTYTTTATATQTDTATLTNTATQTETETVRFPLQSGTFFRLTIYLDNYRVCLIYFVRVYTSVDFHNVQWDGRGYRDINIASGELLFPSGF